MIAYRVTVYAPRSVDPTETTVLTPEAGAPHSDQFKVASKSGVAGFQPYLQETVTSKRGQLDPITKSFDTGFSTLRFLDVRTTAGGSNLSRWLTAFLGGPDKRSKLLGLKVLVEEDDGSGWTDYFTGRISSTSIGSEKIVWDITVRDMAEDLNIDAFVGVPHSSVSYAHTSIVSPVGFISGHGAYANFPTVNEVPATVGGSYASGFLVAIDSDATDAQRIVSEALTRALGPGVNGRPSWYVPAEFKHQFRMVLTRTDLPDTGHFTISEAGAEQVGEDAFLRAFFLDPLRDENGALDTGNPNYMAAPPLGTPVTYYIERIGEPTEEAPIYIDDVHPVVLLEDMVLGKFSRLDAAGAPLFALVPESTSFTALKADASIDLMRLPVKEKERRRDWIVKYILQRNNLGIRFNGSGEVEVVDLRLPSSLSVPTITTDDLVDGLDVTFDQSISTALAGVEITYYLEALKSSVTGRTEPELLTEVSDIVRLQGFGRPDLGEKVLKIDAVGTRAAPDETIEGQPRVDWITKKLIRACEDYRSPYVAGAAIYSLPVQRSQEGTKAYAGDWRLTTADVIPDPDTNMRGGTRLVRVIERREEGPVVWLTVIDSGLDVTSDPPTAGAIAQETGNTKHGVTIPSVTLNSDSEPVLIEFAITETSVGTRPADTAAAWAFGARTTSGGAVSIRDLPSGKRVWVRLRTEGSQGDEPKLPSAWAYPSGVGYVDLAAITAPSGISISGETAYTADASVTTSNTEDRVEYLLDGVSVAVLRPGSTEYTYQELAASTTYNTPGAGVRHVDRYGGVSATAEQSFSTNSTAPTVPAMAADPVIIVPSF